MDVKVAITKQDDSVAIMSFVTVGRGSTLPSGAVWADKEAGQWMREPTPQVIEEEIQRAMIPMKSWRIIKPEDIPKDRTYRNALRDKGAALDWDMPMARELHREKIRHARAGAFLELDAEWMKAVGQSKTLDAAAVEAQKQALRDLPADPRIEAAQTTDELKAVWSAELGELRG